MHFDLPKKHSNIVLSIVACAMLSITACASSAAENGQNKLPTLKIQIAQYTVIAEVADTAQRQQIGLMNRSEMNNNTGMLFVFKRKETQCMWMKNTLINLDVAFADETGKILNIEQMEAGTTNIHCSKGEAKLALEMNRNWFSDRDIRAGEQIKTPTVASMD